MTAYRYIIGLLGLAAFLLCSVCSAQAVADTQTGGSLLPSKSIVVLVDLSVSTKKAVADYRTALDGIGEKMTPEDRLLVAKITDRSEMEPQLLGKYPKNDRSANGKNAAPNDFVKRQIAGRMRAELKEAIKAAHSAVESGTHEFHATDILGSLQIAERVFKMDRGYRGILVILSDMLEQSGEYDFVKTALSDKAIGKILAREKERDRIPDLHGVKVFVVGAAAPTRDRFFEVRKFWIRYFKEAGAELSKENYGSVLLGIE